MIIIPSRVRLVFRILAPFGAFFLLPRLVGVDLYANFVLQFFFFTGALGLVTSPLEHTLIRMRSKSGYASKFAQIFWGYLSLTAVTSFFAVITYYFFLSVFQIPSSTGLVVSVTIAIVAAASQVCYFLKFFSSDWYYYYAEIFHYALIVLFCILVGFWSNLNLLTFSLLSVFSYLGLIIIRLLKISHQTKIYEPHLGRICTLLIHAYRSTTLSSLFGAFIKRADSIYMPIMGSSPEAVLVYRLIRNVIGSVSLVGNIHAQDIWMMHRKPTQSMSPAHYFLITKIMLIMLGIVTWLYIKWLGIPNPLQYADLVCVGASMISTVYLSLNAAEINRVYQQGQYNIILIGSILSLISFLILSTFGKLANFDFVTFLLILVFIPQFVNGIYIKHIVGK